MLDLSNSVDLGRKPMTFSQKLTRAEALSRFRRRFLVPLEWEELVSDPAQATQYLGKPMSRDATHHLLWQVL